MYQGDRVKFQVVHSVSIGVKGHCVLKLALFYKKHIIRTYYNKIIFFFNGKKMDMNLVVPLCGRQAELHCVVLAI